MENMERCNCRRGMMLETDTKVVDHMRCKT